MGKDRQPAKESLRSAGERLQLVSRFYSQRAMGVSEAVASKSVGIPLSTLYRWKSQATSLQKRALSTGMLAIDSAVALLCSKDDLAHLDLVEAAALFISWLRWLTQPKVWQNGVTACLFAYVADRYGDVAWTRSRKANETLLLNGFGSKA